MKKLRSSLSLIVPSLVFFAAACGGDDADNSSGTEVSSVESNTSTDATASNNYDPDGVLKIAMNLDEFDLEVGQAWGFGTVAQHGIAHHVFGSPLQLKPDGSYGGYLAEGYDIPDPSTVELTLRPGLTFQDGSPYDAQTLADTMLEYKEMDTTAFDAWPLDELQSVDVESETELTFNLASPVAGTFVDALAGPPAVIASPDSSRQTPYGAGPYRVVEFVRGDRLVVERWEDYEGPGEYLLGGVEWLHIPAEEAAQNALQSGQVDLIATTPGDVEALKQRGPIDAVTTINQGHLMLSVCKSAPPFDDPKFRAAIDLALNREQINQVVYAGNGSAMAGLWNASAPFAAPDLVDPDGDPEAARQMLSEIGWESDAAFPVGVYPNVPAQLLAAETVVGQLAEVGVDAEITMMESFDVTEYVTPSGGGMSLQGNINAGPLTASVPGLPPAGIWNPCGDDDPELGELLAPLMGGALSDDEAADAWGAVQSHVVDNHLWYPLVTQPITYAYNTERVQNLDEGAVSLSAATRPAPDLEGVSIIG